MKTLIDDYNLITGDSAVAIGKFDGLHLGHEVILKKLSELKKKGLTTILLSFHPSPDVFFGRVEDTELLSASETEEHLAKFDIDYHLILSFGSDLAKTGPEEFLSDILIRELRVKEIVAGEDVSFGYKGRGNAEFLKVAESKGMVKCHILKKLTIDGREVSSTAIRKFVTEGRMEDAAAFLGSRYTFCGIIEEGKHLGRTYGIPTVNFYPEKKKLLPPKGVYFTVAEVAGKKYYAMTNIGIRPSVEEKKGLNLESFLFGNPGNLYGESCKVSLCHYHRPEVKFESLDALVGQLRKDRISCAEYFGIKLPDGRCESE